MREAGWSILILYCASLVSAQGQTCSAPPEYPYTRLDRRVLGRQKFSSGEKVYYNCDEDHSPSRGGRSVQCNDGKWSRLTLKCEKKSCGNAGGLPNGYFRYEGNSVIGEKVYAICNEGYTVKGLNYMICKKSGWSGEFPSCEEGKVTCSTPAVANSVMSEGASLYQVGDHMTFTCSQGFQLHGAPQISCGPDGQWQPKPPLCLPSPDKNSRCGVPFTNENSNSHLADKYFTRTSFASGDRVHYMCDVGYAHAGGSWYRRCSGGRWSPLLLKCERKLCGSAGEILNGQFTYTGVQFGDTATAVCDEGYQLVGRATRNCMNDGWDGRVPFCEAVVCEDPPEVPNAQKKDFMELPYTYRTVVRYQCLVGTIIGPKEMWCTKDGTWSSPPPECKEITCPSPNVPNASWVRAQAEQYQYKETISIVCSPPFTIRGKSTITCGRDGKWFPALPACTQTSRSINRGR